jgi:histidine triad (HIT) family protein
MSAGQIHQSTNCGICEMLKHNETIFEDETVAVLMPEQPASPGHLLLVPKQHASIVEQLPDKTLAELFSKARIILLALFEGLGCHGTNFIIQNGAAAGQMQPHVILNLIPRWENDNLDLMWHPKQLSEEEMSTVELRLKEEAKNIVFQPATPIQTPIIIEAAKKFEEDWAKAQLRRIP